MDCNRETLGRGYVVLVKQHKTAEKVTRFAKIAQLLDKHIAKTARIQLDGRHLLFGEYLL